MSLTEFNEAEFIANRRAEGRAEGKAEGRAEGRLEMLQIYVAELAEDGKEKSDIVSRLVKKYKLSSQEAEALYDETVLQTV